MKRFLKIPLLLMVCILPAAGSVAAFSEEKAGFAVRFREVVCPYKVFGVYALPKESLTIEVIESGAQGGFAFHSESGAVTHSEAREWTWVAPQAPGLYPVRVQREESDDAILLNVFVMFPYERLTGETFNGYRIGSYPAAPLKGLPIYLPPRGFIEVTPDNAATLISPHFTLGQFLCKQQGRYPKCVVLREPLLLKLEYLLGVVNEKGYLSESFHIMSGFRTPYYNAAIGNVEYSRHLWGDAADIFIDEHPRDGMIDDLNRDGRSDEKDSAVLYDLIESLNDKKTYQPFEGGLGRYRSTSVHGPFVHVDVRGFRARWGR